MTVHSNFDHSKELHLVVIRRAASTMFVISKGDVSETVRMFFDDSKSFPPAAKSLLTIQEVDASLTRLALLTKEDEQQNELENIAKM